jgi:hypothetical protein
MAEIKKFSLIKPNIETPFHIDFDWWKQHDSNWRVYLQGCLCQEHSDSFASLDSDVLIDQIDPVTAEVRQIDGLQHVVMNHCALQIDFISDKTSLVDAVFRTFLANGNKPLSPLELEERTQRSGITILRTIGGQQVYKGIRPLQKS